MHIRKKEGRKTEKEEKGLKMVTAQQQCGPRVLICKIKF
jgi:hypothetical protein